MKLVKLFVYNINSVMNLVQVFITFNYVNK